MITEAENSQLEVQRVRLSFMCLISYKKYFLQFTNDGGHGWIIAMNKFSFRSTRFSLGDSKPFFAVVTIDSIFTVPFTSSFCLKFTISAKTKFSLHLSLQIVSYRDSFGCHEKHFLPHSEADKRIFMKAKNQQNKKFCDRKFLILLCKYRSWIYLKWIAARRCLSGAFLSSIQVFHSLRNLIHRHLYVASFPV